MAIQVWTGKGRFRHTHENRACTTAISDLQDEFGHGEQLIIAVFNVQCEHEIDLLVFKRDGIAVIDFKDSSQPFQVSIDKPWFYLDRAGRCLDQKVKAGSRYVNPFQQVKTYREGVMKFLASRQSFFLASPGRIDFGLTKGVVAVSPNLPKVRSEINQGVMRWFFLVGLDNLPRLIADIANPTYDLTNDELLDLVHDVLRCIPLNRLPRANVFVCYAEQDRSIAAELCKRLRPWPVLEVVAPSLHNTVPSETERDIRESDHVLCILTDHSRVDPYVARVLGLAHALREERRAPHPSIFGVLSENKPCSSFVFPVASSHDTLECTTTVDFRSFKRFQTTGDWEHLAESLMTKLTLLDGSDESESLLDASISTYLELFPDQAERDDPDDIRTWLDEARRAEVNGSPWREFYAVLHAAQNVIGMAYVTGHVKHPWLFANYFGVRRGWRTYNRAEDFLLELSKDIRAKIPDAQGFVFEIDPIDFDLLSAVASRPQLGGHEDHQLVRDSLRAAKRFLFYEAYRPLTVLGANGPLPYWQPSMTEGSSKDGERLLILMVHLFDTQYRDDIIMGRTPSADLVESILQFIYDELYKDAYGGISAVQISGFPAYLSTIKAKVSALRHEWSLGIWRLPPANRKMIRTLLQKAEDEGWGHELNL